MSHEPLASVPPPVSDEGYEFVNHPKHYNDHPAGIECIDVIEEMSFNVGTAIKHMWRAGLKPDQPILRDLEKAAWYLNREIKRVRENLDVDGSPS